MPWLYFLLALGCFGIAGRVQSMGLALICLLAALGLILWGTLSLAAARIQARSQNAMALNPALERQRIKRERDRDGDGNVTTSSAASDSGSRRSPDKDSDQDGADGDADSSGGGDGGGGGD